MGRRRNCCPDRRAWNSLATVKECLARGCITSGIVGVSAGQFCGCSHPRAFFIMLKISVEIHTVITDDQDLSSKIMGTDTFKCNAKDLRMMLETWIANTEQLAEIGYIP